MVAKTLLPPEAGICVGVKNGHARDRVINRGLPFVQAGGCKDGGEVSQFGADFSGDISGRLTPPQYLCNLGMKPLELCAT